MNIWVNQGKWGTSIGGHLNQHGQVGPRGLFPCYISLHGIQAEPPATLQLKITVQKEAGTGNESDTGHIVVWDAINMKKRSITTLVHSFQEAHQTHFLQSVISCTTVFAHPHPLAGIHQLQTVERTTSETPP